MSGGPWRSLTFRVLGLVAFVALAGSLVTAVALARTQSQANLDQASATLSLQADNLAARIGADRRVAAATLRARLVRQGVVVAVVAPTSSPPAPFSDDEVGAAAARADPTTRSVGERQWLVVGRPADDGRTVLLARPVAQARGLTDAQRRRVVIGAGIVLAFGAVGGLLLAQGVTRPLRHVAAAARRLTAGERDVRVGPGGPQEVADVAVALDALATQLADAEDRQRRFLLAVSHELRTPLTAVSGYAEALADGVLPPEDVRHAGEVIQAEAGRLQHRVEDLMALARLQAADFRLEMGPTDVAALLRAAATAWGPRARRAEVPLRVEAPRAGPVAWTDGERLRQVVDALADNALRVLPAGAPMVLASGASPGSDSVWVQVRDGGPGMTSQDMTDAFTPGRLTERYRGERPVGSGLGLALVAGLVQRMGGSVSAGPAPEGGVAFTVVLPAHAGPL
jgi:two-component system, OmpR family, sensor kinase